MIELLQNIAGFFVMVAEGISNGIQGVVELLPFSEALISYMPSFLIFPCSVVLSYALVKFVLSLF